MNWRNNWVIFTHPQDTSGEAYELLKAEGIEPYEVLIYNGTRTLLQAMGVDVGKTQVFHGTYHVKNFPEYINSCKEIFE